MGTETLLALVGIAATILIGVPSFSYLRRKYPGQLTFVEVDCLGLFDSIVSTLSQLAVSHNGQPVGPRLVLLRGSIVNTGSTDIEGPMIHEKLTMSIPDGFRWLSVEVVSASPKISATTSVNAPTVATFDFDLLRCEECIRFAALAEVPELSEHSSGKSQPTAAALLRHFLRFRHRIANVGTVRSESLEHRFSGETREMLIFGWTVALSLAGLVTYSAIRPEPELHFRVVPHDHPVEVRIDPKRTGALVLNGVEVKYRTEVSVPAFLAMGPLTPVVGASRRDRFSIVASIVILLAMVLVTTKLGVDWRRTRRLQRILRMPDRNRIRPAKRRRRRKRR